jgi:hypothetical protein
MHDYHDDLDGETGPWTVSLFLVDRAYGGPEEGGWWYTCGEPVLDERLRAFNNRDEADAYARGLRPVEEEMNKGRPSTGSVLSRGEYQYHVQEGWPKAFPEVRPHYE